MLKALAIVSDTTAKNSQVERESKAPTGGVLKKRCFEKFREIHTKEHVPKSFFNKEALALVFSCQFCEVFKNVLQNLSGRLLQEYVLNLIESQGSRFSG